MNAVSGNFNAAATKRRILLKVDFFRNANIAFFSGYVCTRPIRLFMDSKVKEMQCEIGKRPKIGDAVWIFFDYEHKIVPFFLRFISLVIFSL